MQEHAGLFFILSNQTGAGLVHKKCASVNIVELHKL